MKDFWIHLRPAARTGLIGGVALIFLVMAAAAWWLLRADYQVLFSDLKPVDAQAMTVELERQKIPYRIGDEGTSILVDRAVVHATRLKLMGRDLPLHGAVGFELFNNADFGMTEFAQKINYQRALQGEITRTIQSMGEVRDVRVLLALPEQGLFKQATSRAKASVSLTLRQDRRLRSEQIVGIQRLVAAAVPGMTMQDVTIVDHQGVALTRLAGEADGDLQGARLDLKRETETYLTRKVTEVLDRTLGVGQALASVDVTLNMDQVKTTTEDVVASPARPGAQAAGVIVRERETMRDTGSLLDARSAEAGFGAHGGSSQREVEYAVGRRVEQVVSQPGSIRQIQVVTALRKAVDAAQQEQLRQMVAAAVGAVPERGDVVVVNALSLAGTERASEAAVVEALVPEAAAVSAPKATPVSRDAWISAGAAVFVLLVLLGVVFARTPVRASDDEHARVPPRDTDRERDAVLAQIRQWLEQDGISPGSPHPGRSMPPVAAAEANGGAR